MPPARPYLKWSRIAFSAVCGVLCLLLIALWVRSYWRMDYARGPLWNSTWMIIRSTHGQFTNRLVYSECPLPDDKWTLVIRSAEDYYDGREYRPSLLEFKFSREVEYKGQLITNAAIIPYWVLVLISGAFATVTWIPVHQRFSLRTLLIAITVIGLLLGLIIATTR